MSIEKPGLEPTREELLTQAEELLKETVFSDALYNLVMSIDFNFASGPEEDQWRSGGPEPTEEEQEVARDFIQKLLDYKKEGSWGSIEETLDADKGIGWPEDQRRALNRLIEFLRIQGIT